MANPRAFNLSDLMADLQDDGVRDSTGVFTLDPKAAEQKLQNFSLARPQDYVLKLVQAAVANGASLVDLEARTGVVQVEWDGPPLRIRGGGLCGLAGRLALHFSGSGQGRRGQAHRSRRSSTS